MDAHSRARSTADIIKTLSKAGIIAVYDENVGGFLLMEENGRHTRADLWERALRAPVLVLTDEEYECPTCAEIAWRKAGSLLRQPSAVEGATDPVL